MDKDPLVNEFYEELFKHWTLKKTSTPVLINLEEADEQGADLSEIFEVKAEAIEADEAQALDQDSQDPYYPLNMLEEHATSTACDVRNEVSGKAADPPGGLVEQDSHRPAASDSKRSLSTTPKTAVKQTFTPVKSERGMTTEEIEAKLAKLRRVAQALINIFK